MPWDALDAWLDEFHARRPIRFSDNPPPLEAIHAEREAIMKAQNKSSQPIATPNGRGRTVTLNDILAQYSHQRACMLDFRIPLRGEIFLAEDGSWRTQAEPFSYNYVSTPKLIIKRVREEE